MQNETTNTQQPEGLKNILTEEELLKVLSLTRKQLDDFRGKRKLPFLKLSNTCRMYSERDVVAWLKGMRTVLNEASE